MKFGNTIYAVLVSVLCCVVACGCVSESESGADRRDLTPAETAERIQYVRNFLLKSRIPLTSEDRSVIVSREPEVRGFSTGHKKGKITFTWQVSEKRYIHVTGEGELLKNCDWKVSIRDIDSDEGHSKKSR